jgi:hypothetical protein
MSVNPYAARALASQPFCWSDAQRGRFDNSFWKVPCDLVLGDLTRTLKGPADSPLLADLWRLSDGASRGGSMTSLLPLLAVRAYKPGADGFTQFAHVGRDEQTTICGFSNATQQLALKGLEERGMIRLRQEQRVGQQPGERTHVAVRMSLVDTAGEWREFPASLLYGGGWRLLPEPSTRHLLLTLIALDPVKSVEKLVASRPDQAPHDVLWSVHEGNRGYTLSDLSAISGMRRDTVKEALACLTAMPLASPGECYVRAYQVSETRTSYSVVDTVLRRKLPRQWFVSGPEIRNVIRQYYWGSLVREKRPVRSNFTREESDE